MYEQGVEDDAEHVPASKRPKLPALARFVFYNAFSLHNVTFGDGLGFSSSCIDVLKS